MHMLNSEKLFDRCATVKLQSITCTNEKLFDALKSDTWNFYKIWCTWSLVTEDSTLFVHRL